MFELKRLSKNGIEAALKKAERYRLLNEAWEAESICRDVLEVVPDSPEVLVMLLLALTDQFETEPGTSVAAARAVLARLPGAYEREYYGGIICERWGKRLLHHHAPGAGPVIHDWLREAMECYERAQELRPTGDDDAILRWNTCARLIMKHEQLRPAAEPGRVEVQLE